MGTLTVFNPKEIIGVLERLGFQEIRQKGSHKQFRHPDGRGDNSSFSSKTGHIPNSTETNH